MGFLARLFHAVPKEERVGIRLNETNPWRVSPTNDASRFLRALPALVPEGATIYFEGTGEPHVTEYLRRVSTPGQAKVAVGTIWPVPDCYHVPLTAENCEAFAQFLKQQPAGFVCEHCHVYHQGSVLLEWYDAFGANPIHVSRVVSPEMVAEFAARLGSEPAE